jgi:hypothetical protein
MTGKQSRQSKKSSEPFDPVRDTDTIMAPEGATRFEPTGIRRLVEPVPSVMLHWPSAMPKRRELVQAWHAVAMSEVHRAKLSFRLMAVLKDFVHWRNGMIFPTNATLAARAGQCSERIVSDLLGKYEDLGIVRLRFGWRKARNGKWLKTRIIFMTLPKALGFPNHLPHFDEESDDEVEIRVEDSVPDELPSEEGSEVEHSVPRPLEHSVPITHEGTSESITGGDDDAA